MPTKRFGSTKVEKEVLTALRRTRREIIASMNKRSLTSFKSYHLNSILKDLDDILAKAGDDIDKSIRTELAKQYDLGRTESFKSLLPGIREISGATIPIVTFVPMVAAEQLAAVTAFRTDLIRGMAEKAKQKITAELQVSLLKGESIGEAAERIVGTGIGSTARRIAGRSYLQSAYSRAVVIARTELHRGYMAGRTDVIDDMTKQFRGYFEVWRRWSPVVDNRTRPGHKAAKTHRPIKLGEKFRIYAESPAETRLVSYPGDPAGGPENSIHCRCVTIERAFPAGTTREMVSKKWPVR
jgi:hypothetical protein